jgi:hypothetical protein
MFSNERLNHFIILCIAALGLTACGGGGGDSSPPPPATPTITGLAATGGALANATVTAKCTSGAPVSGTTGTDGTFSLPLAGGQTAPCMLQATLGAVTLYSFASSAGYVNITPLTDLAVNRALGSDAAAAFASFDAAKGTAIANGLDAAKTYVVAQVTPVTGAPSGDVLTGAFKVGDPDDVLLDNLNIALVAANKSLDDLRLASVAGGSLEAVVTRQTWFFSAGAALTASQVTSFDAQGLYYNVHSTANPGGEIRGQIVPSSAAFITDNGDPATGNTFSALMSGAQEVPANASKASAYGTIVLDPTARTISGVLVTDGLAGTVAHIHNGLPGVSGPVVFPLAGGPTVWTLAATAITDAQIADLRGGAYYLNVHSTALPGGELRGQLTQQVRFAELTNANEPSVIAPALPSSGTGVLALGTTALANGNFPISGFVKTSGIVNATAAHIHQGATPGATGPVIVPITETPVGSGLWVVPAGSTLTPAQVVSFNTGALYYNVHTTLNPGGEVRGPIVPATVKIGNATLDGASEVPPVTTAAAGTGIIALNSVTRLVNGNVNTTGIIGTLAHVHQAAVGVSGPVIVPLTVTPPPTTIQPPLAVTTTSLADGSVGSAYSESLTATGGTTPYTWTVSVGTLPAGLSLGADGVISGTPATAGTSSFTVSVSDSATPAATATKALSLAVSATAVPTVSFATQIQPIFTASCVTACHTPGGLGAFLDLSTAASSFAGLVQSTPPRVIAGSSGTSTLFGRVSGALLPQMPLGQPPLGDLDQTLIKSWIDQGAANN